MQETENAPIAWLRAIQRVLALAVVLVGMGAFASNASAAPQGSGTSVCPNEPNAASITNGVDADGDDYCSSASGGTDCNDSANDVYPGAAELCTNVGTDNDCDGVGTVPFNSEDLAFALHRDLDGDGYGDRSASPPAFAGFGCPNSFDFGSGLAPYVNDNSDCNDANSAIRPGAAEVCDTYDNDCDGYTDDADPSVTGQPAWYDDTDNDGYGDSAIDQYSCTQPTGYVANSTDGCPTVQSLQDPIAWYDDTDGDGYGDPAVDQSSCTQPPGYVANSSDGCPTDAALQAPVSYFVDSDRDGYGTSTTAALCAVTAPDGYSGIDGDCDDTYGTGADTYPGATETCANLGTDNDCDNDNTEAEVIAAGASDLSDFYIDSDGDTYGTGGADLHCNQPSGYASRGGDCNDGSDDAYPGAAEVCDGIDNDCDTYADDADPDVTGQTTYFADTDSDGYGDPGVSDDYCFPGAGRVTNDDDCNDGAGDVYPGAAETCANLAVDNDCDSVSDEAEVVSANAADLTDYYADADNDGFTGDSYIGRCVTPPAPPGGGPYSTIDEGDCDDSASDSYPGAAETCDGADNDCDGYIDDGLTLSDYYLDSDNDGYGAGTPQLACATPPNHVTQSGDCDDADDDSYPGAAEVCDGADNDCDTLVDDADPGVIGRPTWFADSDGDGYGDPAADQYSCTQPTGYVANSADGCPAVTALQAPATWYRDSDNDGYGDAGDTYASCTQPAGYVANSGDGCPTVQALQAPVPYFIDTDRDGYGTSTTASLCATTAPDGYSDLDGDCGDSYADVYPGATETCANLGTDNDCDSDNTEAEVIAAGAADLDSYYTDADSDGYGVGSADLYCIQPSGYAQFPGDCNDDRSDSYPGAQEVCDGYDNDCDNLVDDDDPSTADAGKSDFYVDADGDTYGAGSAVRFCVLPDTGYAVRAGDCNDTAGSGAAINPAAQEVCDPSNTDEDCDGYADDLDLGGALGKIDYYADSDLDGFSVDTTTPRCENPGPGWLTAPGGDCNDSNPSVNPGATEICDAGNVDEDCNNLADNYDAGADESTKSRLYFDGDGDAWGIGKAVFLCDAADGYSAPINGDCNDTRSDVYPGAQEVCDSGDVDEDCDGLADNADGSALPSSRTTFYRDADSDGYGTSSNTRSRCDADPGFVATPGDCNDSNADMNPGEVEVCDAYNVDEDCDGYSDDADAGITPAILQSTGSPFYRDADGDGYALSDAYYFCDQPSGFLPTPGSDCNDSAAGINPGATEIVDNATDDNCDGYELCYRDVDNDGFLTDAAGGPPTILSADLDCLDAYEGTVSDARTDCNDSDAAINTAAQEICDSGIDNDCDGYADDSDPSTSPATQSTFYRDSDLDGSGDTYATMLRCTAGDGYISASGDCDDSAIAINPGATEVCDAYDVDEDCDGLADNYDSSAADATRSNFFLDTDGDGFGAGGAARFCDRPSGYALFPGDCNDGDAYINPKQPEICDAANVDEDCDGYADDADPVGAAGKLAYFPDTDLDGYGAIGSSSTDYCDPPAGNSLTDNDCNDSNGAVNPGATETCDGIDNDCDGYTDDADPGITGQTRYYPDADLDGYGNANSAGDLYCTAPTGWRQDNSDCNDANGAVNPGATETCDSIDNDCDGYIDDADASVSGQTRYYPDTDTDGYGDRSSGGSLHCFPAAGRVTDNTDCDDAAVAINPGATEICDSGVDNDCDGYADDSDPSVTGQSNYYRDADSDGFAVNAATLFCSNPGSGWLGSPGNDCNDGDPAINPAAQEVCDASNTDEDCDGYADDADTVGGATGKTRYYRDFDNDGFGTSVGTGSLYCDPPAGWLTSNTDCNDTNADINPTIPEICDTYDNDCDGYIDDADPSVTGQTRYYPDLDGDTYGDLASAGSLHCFPAAGRVTDSTDCNDTYGSGAAINPAAQEICDSGTDNDCDGYADDSDPSTADAGKSDFYADSDGDTYGAGSAVRFCVQPASGYSTNDDDCNDTYGSGTAINPGAQEVCDGNVDNDCDGYADDSDPSTSDAGKSDFYADGDDDGYGTGSAFRFCALPADGYSANDDDCDDAYATRAPNLPEVCDAYDLDEDCDGYADDLDPEGANGKTAWYIDADLDGYASDSSDDYCDTPPAGYVQTAGTDCDDARSDIYPGQPEICDTYDNDCNGLTDDADPNVTGQTRYYPDADGDGYGSKTSSGTLHCFPASGRVTDNTDCNDSAGAFGASINPGAQEVCDPLNTDEDCDGYADDLDPQGATGTSTWYEDYDSDGYGSDSDPGTAYCDPPIDSRTNNFDCDDYNSAIKPGATEACDGGIDNDCDGYADDADVGGATGKTTYYRDADGDGYGDANVTMPRCAAGDGYTANDDDCDDTYGTGAAINPAAQEVCDSGVDNDCDNLADDDDPSTADAGKSDFYADADGDGYGAGAVSRFCVQPGSGYSANDDDCYDVAAGGAAINPAAQEICDGGIDNDCDGYADDADASADPATKSTFWYDGDADGYGDQYVTMQRCAAGDGYVGNDDDNCPAEIALRDPVTYYDDSYDNDGYGDPNVSTTLCQTAPPSGYVANDDDQCPASTLLHQTVTLYRDADGDGYGNADIYSSLCNSTQVGYVANDDDCNDTYGSGAAINPAATEVCDSIDNDCDGLTDSYDPGVVGQSTWYRDADGDSYGDPAVSALACTQPDGYVSNSTDGCPTVTSLQAPLTWYRDADSDTYGDPSSSTTACTQPDGYVSNSGDGCPTVQALQAPVSYFRDNDRDGYGSGNTGLVCATTAPDGYSSITGDCNDNTAAISPVATEVCDNLDNDCDGYIDDADPSVTGQTRYYPDLDGDTYGDRSSGGTLHCFPASGRVTDNTDCNDSAGSGAAINPGAQEVCDTYNVDEDCDGYADNLDPSAAGRVEYWADTDGDGYGDPASSSAFYCDPPAQTAADNTDCNDTSSAIYPGAPETCANLGTDNDCDAYNDEAEVIAAGAADLDTYYIDADGDGYGDRNDASGSPFCAQPSGHAPTNDDCDDTYGSGTAINPGATEVCDTVDNDCDGYADDLDPQGAADATTFYRDGDGDGFGDPLITMLRCTAGDSYIAASGDCNDAYAYINPNGTEVCDSYSPARDEDCNGFANDSDPDIDPFVQEQVWIDADFDGFGDRDADPSYRCDTYGYSGNRLDCDDTRASVRPGAVEVCDALDLDDDCSGSADDADPSAQGKTDFWRDSDGDGFGSSASGVMRRCDAVPGSGGWSSPSLGSDCDDADTATYPGAPETCSNLGTDNDCDGQDDEDEVIAAGAADLVDFYGDDDADGYGDPAVTTPACEAPDGYVGNSDDECPDIYELHAPATYYFDGDDDGYGDPSISTDVCDIYAPDDYVGNDDDGCPSDPCKFEPGENGCGIPETFDGQLRAWGLDNYGQIDVPCDLGSVQDAAGGFLHTVALDADGYVHAWGAGAVSPTPNIEPEYGQSVVPAGLGTATRVAAGYFHSMAQLPDGTLRLWGNNASGQCNIPTDLVITDFAGGAFHTVVLLTDGTVQCFGAGQSTPATPPAAPQYGQSIVPEIVSSASAPGFVPVIQVTAGAYFTAVLRADGSVLAWGSNINQQLNVPADLGPVAKLSAGRSHCIALMEDGSVRVWGGFATTPGTDTSALRTVPGDLRFAVDVTGGWNCNAAVDAAGNVYAWGLADSSPDSKLLLPANLGTADRVWGIGRHLLARMGAPMTDVDGDGDPSTTDCDDSDADVNRQATETCNGIDDNCIDGIDEGYSDIDEDGIADCVDPDDDGDGYNDDVDGCPANGDLNAPILFYLDSDGDGYGDPDQYTAPLCAAPAGYVANSADLCPANIALQAPIGYFVDGDSDGYGAGSAVSFCETSAPSGHSAFSTDCDDTNGAIHTNIVYFADQDNDSYGDPLTTVSVCLTAPPSGYVANALDNCATDPSKTEPGDCGCGIPDTDDDGDGVSDCIDPTPPMTLVAGKGVFTGVPTEPVVIDVQVGRQQVASFGANVKLRYDSTRLQFVSAAPGQQGDADGIFTMFVSEPQANAAAGTLQVWVSNVGDPDTGVFTSSAPATVARLTFLPVSDLVEICAESGVVEFDSSASPTTYLEVLGGAGTVTPTTVDLGAITVYTGDALVDVPEGNSADGSSGWPRAADAGVNGSVFADPDVIAFSPCGTDPAVTLLVTYPAGHTPATGTTWPAGNIFPVGTTTVEWTTQFDPSDATTIVTETRSFTVLDHALMQLDVAVMGAGIQAHSRPIEFKVGSGAWQPATVSLAASAGTNGNTAARGSVAVQVPVGTSANACVLVRDPIRTLVAQDSAEPGSPATQWAVSVQLISGDSNQDNVVDILDYALWTLDFGPQSANSRSNFNADGFVNNTDFAVLSGYFLQSGAEGCTGAGDGLASTSARDRVSVAELRKMGNGDMVPLDLNGDGWLDMDDITLFMQGVRPSTGAGSASSAGNSAE